jgi:NADP-dependent 3-hydroxy acid dehydrogenase YdfG
VVKFVNKELKEHNFMMVVDLTENVLVNTPISSTNHAALRSGFAGYPANPRWNAAKYSAWKTGRQLREALASGQMVVRSTDSMLVQATEQDDNLNSDNATTSKQAKQSQLLLKAKQMLAAYQLA